MSIRPARLHRGCRIGIIAPAGPVAPSEVEPAIALLKEKGYHVSPSPHLYDRLGYLAGDDDTRLSDFHLMFRDREIHAVICARGGYGTLRLLDRIDYDLIRRNPKILVGYSDITALLLAVQKETGLITFHGPMVRDLPGSDDRFLVSLLHMVSSGDPFHLDLTGGTPLRQGKAEGILMGGNLSLITCLIGTPFLPSLRGVILFIEERGESLYRIDRMLTHMKLSGLLSNLAGLIAGGFEDIGDISALEGLLRDCIDQPMPVFSGLPVGHGMNNITLPIGSRVELDTERMTLTIQEACVLP